MYGYPANITNPLLYSNSLHRIVGETVPKLYSRAFIYFRRSITGMFLRSSWHIAMHSLSVELMDISVWSCNLYITGHPKYDTRDPDQERSISESFLSFSGNQLPPKSASAHTLTSLLQGRIYVPIFQVPSIIALSSWHPHHVIFLDPRRIACIGVPCMKSLIEYCFPSI